MTKHPRIRVAIPAVFTVVAVLFWGSAAQAYFAGGGKDASKGNDCLIGYNGIDESDVTTEGKKQIVSCTDCDPSCDLDGDNTANGSCTFKVGVCIDQPGVANCTPAAGLDKAKATAKVKGVKGKIDVQVPQLLEGSVCGALLDLDVPVKETKKGAKDGSGTVSLSAQVKKNKAEGIDKARKDKDKLTYVCVPRPEGEPCPTTTTTTTTLPPKPCGNGVVDAGEECDPNAEPTGCSGGETCIPDCTCAASCAAPSGADPTSLTFTTGLGTTQCGTTGFKTPAEAPLGGALHGNSCTCAANADCGTGGSCAQGHCAAGAAARIACTQSTDCAAGQTCEASQIDLGLGCLYIGGGSSTVPGGVTPNDAPSTFAVDLVCDGGDTLVLGGSATGIPGGAPADVPKSCTVEDGPTRFCANGNPGTDSNGACTTDADCRPNCVDGHCVNGAPGPNGDGTCSSGSQCGSGSEGCIDPDPEPPDACEGIDGLVCIPVANCYFGPPLPVRNGPLSTCVLNVFDNDAFGVAHKSAGTTTLGYTLSSRVYFTSLVYTPEESPVEQPCPVCNGGTCNAGPNQGQPCVGVGVDGTTQDCPPDGFYFLAPLGVTLDPLTTGASTLPANGTASSNGNFCPAQSKAGAFTAPSTRLISMQGAPVAGGLDGTAKAATLVSAFCIPKTGSTVIDSAANLPGPGATSLGGTLQLQ